MTSSGVLSSFIDGCSCDSTSDELVDVINPSTGQACASLPIGSSEDIARAVAAARVAFDEGWWSEAGPSVRKRALYAWADLVACDAASLDALDAEEMGKPVGELFANAAAAAGLVRFYAEAADKITGDVFTSDRSTFVTQRRVSRGVVAAITPWNFPTYNVALKVASALAAGNCVVLKPSELSTRSALRLAELAVQAGVPAGAFNVVPGLGESVGRALALHMQVDMVTFTGSTAVGKQMLTYAGQSNMKVVLAECGGKSPHVVFADGVDLDDAARAIAGRLVTNQGQICSVGSRVLVQRSIEESLLSKIIACVKQVVVGDARDPTTTFGPVASAAQCGRVVRYIESAPSEGAELAAGGRRVLEGTGGFYVEPTIFRAVPPTARIAQEEIFGPVLAVSAFDSEDEAVRLANGTTYGLTAYVWTASLSRGLRVAKALRSAVRVNAVAPTGEGAGHMSSVEPAGQSGVGVEGGLAGMESYLRRQLVWINHA